MGMNSDASSRPTADDRRPRRLRARRRRRRRGRDHRAPPRRRSRRRRDRAPAAGASGELGAAGIVAVDTARRRRCGHGCSPPPTAAGHRAPSRPPASPVACTASSCPGRWPAAPASTPDQWTRPVDPPELAGWTVHDVAVHLAANEALLASALGVGLAGVPETEPDQRAPARRWPGPATATVDPAVALDELEAAAAAVDAHLASPAGADLDRAIEFWGRTDAGRRRPAHPVVRDVDPRRRRAPRHRRARAGAPAADAAHHVCRAAVSLVPRHAPGPGRRAAPPAASCAST